MSTRSFFRLYCPRSCLEENPHISRVIGTGTYSDVSLTIQHQDQQRLKRINISYITFSACTPLQKSSICRSAVHAGVIKNGVGGYIDVMPVDKRRHYIASYQNGIFSERYVAKLRYNASVCVLVVCHVQFLGKIY